MQTYRIEHHDPERRTGPVAWVADIKGFDSPMSAVHWAAKCYTWARGWSDYETGLIWPFNPEMLVDGRRSCEVAAEEFGGAYADALARRDGNLAEAA